MAENPVFSYPLRVAEIPADGRSITITADTDARDALARSLGIPAVNALRADLSVAVDSRQRVAVRGRLQAEVTRTCVVTLDEMAETVDEIIATDYEPAAEAKADREEADIVVDPQSEDSDFYAGGMIDLGLLVSEHLALGLDPYPRKPKASFERREEMSDSEASPFSALAGLRISGRTDE